MSRLLFTIFLISLLVFSTITSENNRIVLNVPAVSILFKGISTELDVEIIPGRGRALISTEPYAGIDMQRSEKIAKAVAEEFTKINLTSHDIIVTMHTEAKLIDGPSAGAAMTVGMISILSNRTIRSDVMMTGTILKDGGIGPVSGIFTKAKAAADAGARIFLVPEGQSQLERGWGFPRDPMEKMLIDKEMKILDLNEYAQEHWNLTVVEVGRIEHALYYFWGEIDFEEMVNHNPQLSVEPISFRSTNPMEDVAHYKINEAKARLKYIKEELSVSAIQGEYLPKVEKAYTLLEEAEIALKNNNFYVAANFAFNICIETEMMYYVLTYYRTGYKYGFLRRNKAIVADKLGRTKNIILPELIQDKKAMEWILAAQLRASWAQARLNKLNTVDHPVTALYTLAIMNQWIDAVNIFTLIADHVKTGKAIEMNTTNMKTKLINSIYQLEKTYSTPKDFRGNNEAAYYAMLSAKLNLEQGWIMAAYFDYNMAKVHFTENLEDFPHQINNYHLYNQLSNNSIGLVWIDEYEKLSQYNENHHCSQPIFNNSYEGCTNKTGYYELRSVEILLALIHTLTYNVTVKEKTFPPRPTIAPYVAPTVVTGRRFWELNQTALELSQKDTGIVGIFLVSIVMALAIIAYYVQKDEKKHMT